MSGGGAAAPPPLGDASFAPPTAAGRGARRLIVTRIDNPAASAFPPTTASFAPPTTNLTTAFLGEFVAKSPWLASLDASILQYGVSPFPETVGWGSVVTLLDGINRDSCVKGGGTSTDLSSAITADQYFAMLNARAATSDCSRAQPQLPDHPLDARVTAVTVSTMAGRLADIDTQVR